ncbi:hypothetical protein NC653_005879 [Populus alba x Populus x berolinensis]|uniref:Uncharacterized protein n=1 Tax=Populus alba x Populus x berolinensis TaxID=444605 RepID=A0AAD6RE94_9ROSI|nr:hypothetical protein NC653_005879 [Populus alba x Populus x berolinensis]
MESVLNFMLYSHLVATVDSENFLTQLKSLQQASINETGIQFPFKEATGLNPDTTKASPPAHIYILIHTKYGKWQEEERPSLECQTALSILVINKICTHIPLPMTPLYLGNPITLANG